MWEAYEQEQPYLMAYRGPFDGFHAVEAAVSKTCLVRFDRNQYSVESRAVGRYEGPPFSGPVRQRVSDLLKGPFSGA